MTDLEKRVIEALRAKWFQGAADALAAADNAEQRSDRETAIELCARGDVYEQVARDLGNALDAADALAKLGVV